MIISLLLVKWYTLFDGIIRVSFGKVVRISLVMVIH